MRLSLKRENNLNINVVLHFRCFFTCGVILYMASNHTCFSLLCLHCGCSVYTVARRITTLLFHFVSSWSVFFLFRYARATRVRCTMRQNPLFLNSARMKHLNNISSFFFLFFFLLKLHLNVFSFNQCSWKTSKKGEVERLTEI